MTTTAFETPVSELFNNSTVYVVPTFQRPYAWEDTQWNEMIEDIRTAASKVAPYHYFAPVHIIPILSPKDPLWISYVDKNIIDLKELEDSGFRSDSHGSISVFLVIDGQQRLTTFYSLLYQYPSKTTVKLKSNFEIPNVILNAPDDQIAFRNMLGLISSHAAIKNISRAQKRLESMFLRLNNLANTDFDFKFGNRCHDYFTSRDCVTLPVKLSKTVRLAAFMTLNDRGKSLSNLEKTKSLFMEIDDNPPVSSPPTAPQPVVINNAFGAIYQSLEAADAYINDDEFLRQLGMSLWEYVDTSNILKTPWPPVVIGKKRSNYIHQIGTNTLYDEYFKKLPSTVAWKFLHGEIVPAIKCVTKSHNQLVALVAQAKSGSTLGKTSFVNSLGFGSRDAIEDYYSVLISLGLQSRQIGFLLATHQLSIKETWGKNWHDVLDIYQINNQGIKTLLAQKLAEIQQQANQEELNGIDKIIEVFSKEINSIANTTAREYSALQIAEALRLIVENKKPANFGLSWQNAFNCSKSVSQNTFVTNWLNFITGYQNREKFIWKIAHSTEAYNDNYWVSYLLREYEYCISGRNAHRNPAFEIEHCFASAWGDKNPGLLATIYGFAGVEQYKSSFAETIGNKLVLDVSLNRALQDQDPGVKVTAFQRQAYGSIAVMTSNPSQSAIEIGNDLAAMNPAQYRVYIQLRSLRLAIFAAKRF